MTSFTEIRDLCIENSRLSRLVIDDILINFAAKKDNLENEALSRIKTLRNVATQIDRKYINFFTSEFIAHRIFNKNGLIKKYLKNDAIINLRPEYYSYLTELAEYPWRYSFAVIINKPHESFFLMEDVFTGEEYLLFSPGMKATEEESHPTLWFNLIGYNGKCWQTFGLIMSFKAFFPDDIFFFATELNPQIDDEESLMKEVEKNPWPFFMLLNYSTIPLVVSGKEEIRLMFATDYPDNFDVENLPDDFIVENNKNICRLAHKNFGEFPHFAIAYYNNKDRSLLRTSMTQKGFDELTTILNSYGLSLPAEAEIAISPVMLNATSEILNRKINPNPYEDLFHVPPDEKESERLAKMNHFFRLALPYYNEKKEIDTEKMSKATGLDEENIKSLWNHLKNNAIKKR